MPSKWTNRQSLLPDNSRYAENRLHDANNCHKMGSKECTSTPTTMDTGGHEMFNSKRGPGVWIIQTVVSVFPLIGTSSEQ